MEKAVHAVGKSNPYIFFILARCSIHWLTFGIVTFVVGRYLTVFVDFVQWDVDNKHYTWNCPISFIKCWNCLCHVCIWNQHEKCTRMNTNKPIIWSSGSWYGIWQFCTRRNTNKPMFWPVVLEVVCISFVKKVHHLFIEN